MASRLLAGTLALVLLGSALSGCTTGTPTAPTTPAATVTVTTTTPAAPGQTGALFGVVTETTSSGPKPIGGIGIDEMTCAKPNCPDSIQRRVTTGADGTYRISGLYNGDLNFIWLESTEGYVSAAPPPSVPCDFCDAIVTVNGETRLDLVVVHP